MACSGMCAEWHVCRVVCAEHIVHCHIFSLAGSISAAEPLRQRQLGAPFAISADPSPQAAAMSRGGAYVDDSSDESCYDSSGRKIVNKGSGRSRKERVQHQLRQHQQIQQNEQELQQQQQLLEREEDELEQQQLREAAELQQQQQQQREEDELQQQQQLREAQELQQQQQQQQQQHQQKGVGGGWEGGEWEGGEWQGGEWEASGSGSSGGWEAYGGGKGGSWGNPYGKSKGKGEGKDKGKDKGKGRGKGKGKDKGKGKGEGEWAKRGGWKLKAALLAVALRDGVKVDRLQDGSSQTAEELADEFLLDPIMMDDVWRARNYHVSW